ncbi:c-type cytochrome biogenesis protein CcsB [Paenarthrobacter sp. DKR-5]|uniref:c-type cytochrome biogenesis protein CcsB n=1 Tax=Paenarthrobacter sp. DKR-5 TaxID=2835535 RepID=UPI001BDCAB8C|nr:c-type cytochrome biogenesis protein CcsB [Paenarthrobacter sp. DKR-5]MBT1001285.1 c-type cytochrome biogenesis protein CcsB [Paenarthrobacter sp. DKR-5]
MGINETLGQYSELFMLLAGVAYTVAFISFTIDLARSSKTTKAVEARSAAAARVPVLAGAGASAGMGGSSGPEGLAERPAAAKSSGGGGLTADDSMRYGGERRVVARVAVALTVLAAVIHGVGVVTRGIAAARVPWGNMYEFCTTGGLIVTVVFLLVLTRRDLRFLGTFVVGLSLIMLIAAETAFQTPVGHLVPALQSYWLVIHVSVAVFSAGLFTLTFAMSVLQLLQSRRTTALAAGKPDRMPFMRQVPSALSLENLAYRINTIGFVTWTFTLMFGALWAEKAWGRFWGWDTKEVWTFVIWVVYAGYLHARATRGWTGTRAAWLSIVGYLCVVFNFTIVNVFFSGLHSYAGLPS